jgi:hypothetical protein
MPKRKEEPTPETVAAQKQRFIEKAKELGVDETGEEFERLFARVVRAKDTSRKSQP